MNKVYIFEQLHMDGCGNFRIDAYVPVDSYETGDEIINRTIAESFKDENIYKIERFNDDHIAVITLQEGVKMLTFDNCVLQVKEMEPLNMETILDKLNKYNKKEKANDWNNRDFDIRFSK